jgi:hypothetical protein
MNRQKLFMLCVAVSLCVAASACGGGSSTPTSGFKVKGEKYVRVFDGSLRFVSAAAVRADWQFDFAGATGTVFSFGPAFCQGPCTVTNGRVPARWFITAGASGECFRQITNPNMDVSAGQTKTAQCEVFGIVFPFSASPSTVNLQAPPATLEMTGSNLTTTYGMPRLEYLDPYTGNLIGTATATSVSGDGTWLQAYTPDLSGVYSGTYTIFISNATSGGGFEYVGSATMDAYGRDGSYEDPPPDPDPCSCTGDGPCMVCEAY